MTFAANSSTVRTIFNNDEQREIRLYAGLVVIMVAALTITSDTAITAVTVNTSQNGGYRVSMAGQ